MIVRLPRPRLAAKLTAALIGVSLLAVALIAVAYHLSAAAAFDRMVTSEANDHFSADIVAYYRQRGSLNGVAQMFAPPAGPPGQGPSGGGAPPPGPPTSRPEVGPPRDSQGIPIGTGQGRAPIAFGFADATGVILIPGDSYVVGQQAPVEALARGYPLRVNGSLIGTTLLPSSPLPPSSAEQEFADRLNGVLVAAAAGVAALAVFLAAVLARNITRPLSQLMVAASEIAAGNLSQRVSIKSHDEVGELGAAFNKMSDDLERYEQSRKQMTADIAHELRTPLTTISGYAEAMRDGELQPTKERLDAVYRGTTRLATIVEDLRLLSMAEVGALPLHCARISMQDLIYNAVEAHILRATQRGIALRAVVQEEAPPMLADAGRIQQVIEILVNNALRHTQQGEIVVSGSAADDRALITVADTGSGIEPEVLPHVFERFYRGDKARSSDAQGSGLGLAIAKAIVNAHDGSIAVASRLGLGTEFEIRLPLAPAHIAA
ncbi:MAG: HAMP domain-containing histidine kinase [Chloroflexi bacterium]|nr:HAMP domain-containing histidine kinase [Chloroflexota bacterium]